MASKVCQTIPIPAGSLTKQKPSKNIQKEIKNQLFNETKKMKQLHKKIPKLKREIVIIRVNQKEVTVKDNLKQTKSNFFSRKI